jgi:hypothetical protein
VDIERADLKRYFSLWSPPGRGKTKVKETQMAAAMSAMQKGEDSAAGQEVYTRTSVT